MEWEELNVAVHRFQQAMMAIQIRTEPGGGGRRVPDLGGGCESRITAPAFNASAETLQGSGGGRRRRHPRWRRRKGSILR